MAPYYAVAFIVVSTSTNGQQNDVNGRKMMNSLSLSRWGDPYDREARLYPALISMMPILVLFGCLYGPKHPLLVWGVSIVTACGGPLLLSRLARDLGKALEEKLIVEWMGKPTTILLRHSDRTIDPYTKALYHETLGTGLSRKPPTLEDEETNRQASDDFYRASTDRKSVV